MRPIRKLYNYAVAIKSGSLVRKIWALSVLDKEEFDAIKNGICPYYYAGYKTPDRIVELLSIEIPS